MMYPVRSTAPQPHEDMSPSVQELYRESGEVFGISRRAGAALARATLERLLKELDPDAGKLDLAGRIERITPTVSGSLGQMLTVIRHAGNKSLHVEDQPDDVIVLILDPEEDGVVEIIFQSINDLVEELVTRPARAQALFEKVPQGVRDNVGKRAEKPLASD